MTRYNDIARAAPATVPSGPNALRISEGMLGIMLAGGIPPQIAAWSLDRLFLYIVSDAYENSLQTENLASGTNLEEYYQGFTDHYRALPADRFPHIRAHAEVLTSGDGAARFEFGLDMLIDGLARHTA
jgi:hypothetical protein